MSSSVRAQVCRIIPFAIDLCGRIKCFRFLKNLQGLSVVCTEGDTAHVNVLVAHGDEAEVLLAGALTSGSEEGDCATVRGLGSNPPVVGVHFGIEDADVHVFARGPMMTVRLTPHSRLRRLVMTRRLRLTAWSRPP